MLKCAFVAVAASFWFANTIQAGIIASYEIGDGTNAATIQIDQEDGDGYLFIVHWTAPTYTSWEALIDIDESLPALSLQYETYSWGAFLTGISIDGDNDYGVGDLWPIENYWHFWIADTGSWSQAMFGASDRALFNGANDAWVFGSGTAPQGVPAPAALSLLLASAAACQGSRRRGRTRASRAH